MSSTAETVGAAVAAAAAAQLLPKVGYTWARFPHAAATPSPSGSESIPMCSLTGTPFVAAADAVGTRTSDSTGRYNTKLYVGEFVKSASGDAWLTEHTRWFETENSVIGNSVSAPEARTNAVFFCIRAIPASSRYYLFFGGGVRRTDAAYMRDAYVAVIQANTSFSGGNASGGKWIVSWLPVYNEIPGRGGPSALSSTLPTVPSEQPLSADEVGADGLPVTPYYLRFAPTKYLSATNSCPFIARDNDHFFLARPLPYVSGDSRNQQCVYVVRLRHVAAGGGSGDGGEFDVTFGAQGVVEAPQPGAGPAGVLWPLTPSHGLRLCPLVPGFILGIEAPPAPTVVDDAFRDETANAWIAHVQISPEWSPSSPDGAGGGFALTWQRFGRCPVQSPLPRAGALVVSTGYRFTRDANTAIVAVWGGVAYPGGTIDAKARVFVGTFSAGTGQPAYSGVRTYIRNPTFSWQMPATEADGSSRVLPAAWVGACETNGSNAATDPATADTRVRFITFGGSTSESRTRTAVLTLGVPGALLRPGVGIGETGVPCFVMDEAALGVVRTRLARSAAAPGSGATDDPVGDAAALMSSPPLLAAAVTSATPFSPTAAAAAAASFPPAVPTVGAGTVNPDGSVTPGTVVRNPDGSVTVLGGGGDCPPPPHSSSTTAFVVAIVVLSLILVLAVVVLGTLLFLAKQKRQPQQR